eukprot:2543668-Prymnesium_polylepis.1
MIVADPSLRGTQVVRALTYIETYSIDRDAMYLLAEPFPRTTRVLQKRAVLIAMKNKLLGEARRAHSSDEVARDRKQRLGGL